MHRNHDAICIVNGYIVVCCEADVTPAPATSAASIGHTGRAGTHHRLVRRKGKNGGLGIVPGQQGA